MFNAGMESSHQHDEVGRVAAQIIVEQRQVGEFQKVNHDAVAALADAADLGAKLVVDDSLTLRISSKVSFPALG